MIVDLAMILFVATALQIIQYVLCVKITLDFILWVFVYNVVLVTVLNVQQIIVNVKNVLPYMGMGYHNREFVKDVFNIGVKIVSLTRVYV